MSYKHCEDCKYCRIDEDTNEPYCKRTYTNVCLESSACSCFVDEKEER